MTTKLRRARSVLATALVLVAGVILAMRTADAAARTTVVAYFDNSNGVFAGDDVLIRGVPVGKIVKIEPQPLRAPRFRSGSTANTESPPMPPRRSCRRNW